MWVLTLLILIWGATAGEVRNLYDKSHPRDNTFCKIDKRSVEFQLRSLSPKTDPNEKGSGEVVFYQVERKQPHPLQIGVESSGTYRFLKADGTLCTKSAGFRVHDDDLAILFLKENRPFRGKLVIQIFDPKALMPKKLLETDYLTTKVVEVPKSFAFNSIEDDRDIQYGELNLKDSPFKFQDRLLNLWHVYDPAGMKLSPEITYEQFPWKHLFRDREHFQAVAGWDGSQKKFQRRLFYWAVSHSRGQECVFFSAEKVKLSGSEAWLCANLAPKID